MKIEFFLLYKTDLYSYKSKEMVMDFLRKFKTGALPDGDHVFLFSQGDAKKRLLNVKQLYL